MHKFFRKIRAGIIALLVSALPVTALAAEGAAIEKLLEKPTQSLKRVEGRELEKDRFYGNFLYEPSSIKQGGRVGHWNEFYYTTGYIHEKFNVYSTFSRQERFGENDYTGAVGMYLNIDPEQYLHLETGYGWDVDFIYRCQNIAEYGHRLYKNLFWQYSYTYRSYNPNDTHLLKPGLIYYFGDSYLSADYGVSIKESMDKAQFGAVKGDLAFTPTLHGYGGVAFGEKLYDIYGLSAAQERGYLLFAGVSMTVYKDIKFQVGCSYGTEKPAFIKRSIHFGISFKF